MSLPFVSAEEVRRRCDYVAAADALEGALLAGLDPEEEPARGVLELVVESRASALREAGDVIAPLSAGVLAEADLVTLAQLVRDAPAIPADRPRVFESTGMARRDAVVAGVVVA